MKCEEYLNLIDDLVEGELDEQSSRRVNLHVFACPECASLFETLKREKEMYAHYLFEVEPASDLLFKFRTKLKSEAAETPSINKLFARVSHWKISSIELLRFSPAITGAVLLFIFGLSIVLLNPVSKEKVLSENEDVSKIELNDSRTKAIETAVVVNNEVINLPAKTEQSAAAFSEKIKNNGKDRYSNPGFIGFHNGKSNNAKTAKTKEIKTFAAKKQDLPEKTQLDEDEKTQRLLVKTLENETAKQIEKVELLLRSFRNSRFVEGTDEFDLAYEEQQARKLLEKNVQLRRRAETYGSFYTEEMLSRIEPYLLDISNIEDKPSPERVRDIKEHVKNQNIIGSLQIYNY